MANLLIWLNSLVSLVSGAAGLVALRNPSALSKSFQVTRGEVYYQRMYSGRAISLEMFTGVIPFYHQGPTVAGIIGVTAAVQMMDVWIGIAHNDMGMACGALFAALVHGACCFAVY